MGKEYPSYRGDIINGPEVSLEARVPNPNRLVKAYHQCSATLNLIRGFSTGGYARLSRVDQWNLDFMEKPDEGKLYMDLASRVRERPDEGGLHHRVVVRLQRPPGLGGRENEAARPRARGVPQRCWKPAGNQDKRQG